MCKYLVVLTLAVCSVQADSILIRDDLRQSNEPRLTLAYRSPEFELWGYSLDTTAPIFEIGHIEPIALGSGNLLVGGYLSYWQSPDQLYAEPSLGYAGKLGEWSAYADLRAYAPLNGGSWQMFTTGWTLTHEVGDLKVGPYTTFWVTEGKGSRATLGLTASVGLGDHAELTLRAGYGFNEPDSLRFQLTLY